MEEILQIIQSGVLEFEIPDTVTQIGATALQYAKFLGILVLGVLVLSSLNRFLFGKENQINLAVTSAMEILCLYVLNIVICALGLDVKLFLTPLPFVTLAEEYLFFCSKNPESGELHFSRTLAEHTAICKKYGIYGSL